MKKKKIELEVGQIWAVLPLEKTCKVRIITENWEANSSDPRTWYVEPFFLDGTFGHGWIIPEFKVLPKGFRSWITRTGAVLIGRYDFETGKPR